MNDTRVRLLVFAAVFVVVAGVYLYSAAPTAAFWDCGELISAAFTMGVPHPPGTPLFVTLGRIFSMLPVAKEVAFRVTLIPVLFGAFSCGLIYLLVLKLISSYVVPERRHDRWLPHVAGVFGGLACAFAFSFWDNSVEAEVYGPCVVVALSVLYMALVWREQLKRAGGDNRLILAAIFLLFLSTGIHFTPMMTVFAVLVFALIVDREAVLQLRLFELFAAYLVILTMAELGLSVAAFVAIPLMLGAAWYGIRVMDRSTHTRSVFYGLGLFFLVFVIAYVAAGNAIMDDTVLFLASPTVALIERWVRSPMLLLLLVASYGGYLYWLHRQRRLSPKYVGLMLGLVLLAGTVQFIMFIRASHSPTINEADPSNWRDFVSVLKREQYDPMKLLPRKTQFLTEDDWRMNRNPRFGVLVAYFEQVKFYLRYFFWQWGNARFFDIFLHVGWQALLGLIPPLLGLWGMWHQFRREKRSFVLIFVAFLVASIGLVTYLNLKYSPSDPRRGNPAQGGYGYLEVRERDYFYAFSFVFYTIFVGVGAYAFLRTVIDRLRFRRAPAYALSGALLAFGFVPMLLNYPEVSRRGDWIPAEYGYNMLASCPGERAVLFTNGDNDTFPLWFMQTVPSRIAGYSHDFGKNVRVGILSLLNTNWYIKQLKRWGAPISFTEEEIEQLPRGFVGKNNRTFLLEDVMIRDMVATAGGVKLNWPEDYAATSEEYIAKVFGPGYKPRTPVYIATTVSPGSLQDVKSHLRLEGLVYRVVPDAGSEQVDLDRSRYLVDSVYSMKSILDPRVSKDENTRGLLLTYAATFMSMANGYRRLNRPLDAEHVLTLATGLDLDRDRRMTVLYHLSSVALENGNYDRALAALDTIQALGFTQPDFALRRGLAHEGKENLKQAESAYIEAMSADPGRGEVVQALVHLYLGKLGDTAKGKALLQLWLRRAPSDSAAARQLQQLS
ncbi:tetratricopeptide repeat protein [candidate division WOR-3 bacterium]|uniref:Tetratricopeptide repeat protein n=1 Tax=candidate division WOR-3 bacterium TaxID=2052148 RepID=A0A937XFG9_UNCW3|nr:tetratricopeptide repeat protein [candidate division WOR-3 bacterium]